MIAALLAQASMAHAPDTDPSADRGLWPSHAADPRDWPARGEALESPVLGEGGSRVALIATVVDDGPPLALEVRGWRAGAPGPWIPLEQTHLEGEHRVLVADLDPASPHRIFDAVQLRLPAEEEWRVAGLRWEAVVPRYPDAGRRSRELSGLPGVALTDRLPPELRTIGVISRAEWGARRTTCTDLENDWYRMAIHHTAGGQTSGGTTEGAVRTTQAYMMDSGTYCDLAYQFMIGFDGSLFEGRPYGYYSGATGGNNDGNAAACFLGCYHPEPACATAHDDTDEMIESAQLLVQTFSRLHAFATTEQEVKGHRDWPGNSTACPGDFVWARLDEIRADEAWFTATEVSRSATDLSLAPGEQAEVTLTLRNEGGLSWEPGEVWLGTTGPRDQDSLLADASWGSGHRAATVDAVVPPGAEATFTVGLTAPSDPGTYTVTLGLVAEFLTWFADPPWGGGPADDLLTITVEVSEDPSEPPGDTGGAATDQDPVDTGDPGAVPLGFVPPERVPLGGGCGCGPGTGGAGGGALGLAALALARRRRRGGLRR